MKLGEALARRADAQKRIAELRTRLGLNALVQEGDQPREQPDELLAELEERAVELEALMTRINRTNLATRMPDGATLTEALARREMLGVRHGVLSQLVAAALPRGPRYSRSEIRFVATFDVRGVQKRADDVARRLRELDTLIQEVNWATDLVD